MNIVTSDVVRKMTCSTGYNRETRGPESGFYPEDQSLGSTQRTRVWALPRGPASGLYPGTRFWVLPRGPMSGLYPGTRVCQSGFHPEDQRLGSTQRTSVWALPRDQV